MSEGKRRAHEAPGRIFVRLLVAGFLAVVAGFLATVASPSHPTIAYAAPPATGLTLAARAASSTGSSAGESWLLARSRRHKEYGRSRHHDGIGEPLASSGPLTLFVEPDAGAGPIMDAIAGARRSLDVEVYILTDRDVMAALEAAQRRGVTVRVLLEGRPFNPQSPGHPLAVNLEAARQLATAAISWRWTSRTFTFTHEKALVADHATAVITTANFSHAALSRNREFGVVDRNPADVAMIERLFDADWSHRHTAISSDHLVVSPDNARHELAALIASARRSIAVEDEEADDPALLSLLGQKARSGVTVQVELARFRQGGTDAREQAALAGYGVQQVRFLSRPFLHAKQILVDGRRAYLGSVNLTASSLDRNRELGIVLADPKLVGVLRQVADRDWTAGSSDVDPENSGD